MKECLDVIKVALEQTWVWIPWLRYVMYLAIVSILVFEKDKTKKLVFGAFSLFLLIMLFNPLTVIGMKPFFGASWIYYVRFYLIIPIPVIMAYGITLVFSKFNDLPKLGFVIVFVVVMILKGDYIYDDVNFKKAENLSKVPRDIVQLSDLLSDVEGYKKVLVSSAINVYIRQIDASILLPFGRNDGVNTISEELDSENPDVEYVIDYVINNNCDYFMTKRCDTSINEYLEKNCKVIGYTDNYALIRYNESPIRTYDKYGNLSSITYTDEPGNAVRQPRGYVTVRYNYDINGRMTYESYKDAYDESVMIDCGYAAVKYDYDHYGNLIETSYYDDDMKLTVNEDGYAIVQNKYDNKQNIIEISYLDSERNPVFVQKYGYATIRFERTFFGEIASGMYYDEYGVGCEQLGGYYGYELKYNEDKRPIEWISLDANGDSVLTSSGYAITAWEYDDRGNIVRTRYLDEEGNSVPSTSGEYGFDSVRDESGLEIERIYVDEKGMPISVVGGYDTIKYVRDISGQVIKELYYLEGEPYIFSQGYSGIMYEYDSKGYVIKNTYVDSEGKAMMISNGYSWIIYERNADGTVISSTYYDIEGNVVREEIN